MVDISTANYKCGAHSDSSQLLVRRQFCYCYFLLQLKDFSNETDPIRATDALISNFPETNDFGEFRRSGLGGKCNSHTR